MAAPKGADVEQAVKVLRLNREAIELYEALEFELARKSLHDALEIGRSGGLNDHAVIVRTHANLGVVYAVGLQDNGKALEHFKRALELKADYKLSRDIATPAANALFSQAARELKAAKARSAKPPVAPATDLAADGRKKAPAREEEIDALLAKAGQPLAAAPVRPAAEAPAATPAPDSAVIVAEPGLESQGTTRAKGAMRVSTALKCPTAGEVDMGDEITLRCVTSGDLKPASVILFYKRSGRETFTAVPMKVAATGDERKASWVANIPGNQVGGAWLPFYFEARDRAGTALALAGRDDSPNIITIRGGQDAEDDDEPAAISTKRSRRDADDEARGEGEENPLAGVEAEKRRSSALKRRYFVGFGVGAGGGYAGGRGVEAYRQYVKGFSAGFAPQGLGHGLPEIGYFVTPDFALSLMGRHQYIPKENAWTAGGANSVLARALLFFGEGDGRFYAALAAGGGEGVRMVVTADTTSGGQVKDTVRGGPVLAGAGIGFNYAFGEMVNWMVETGVLAGFPTFSAAFDVNTGLRFRF